MTPDSNGLFWGHQLAGAGPAHGSTHAAGAMPVPLALESICHGCTEWDSYVSTARTQPITFQKMHQTTELLSSGTSVWKNSFLN